VLLCESVPITPAVLCNLVTGYAGTVVDPVQFTYFIIFAVGMSLAFGVVRRSLKLGR